MIVVGDRFALEAVCALAPAVIDQRLFRALVLGLPHLAAGQARELLEAYEGFTAVYRPDMLDRRRFDDAVADPLLAAAGVRCPSFTFEVFERSMRYAEEVGWGKSLFDDTAGILPGAL